MPTSKLPRYAIIVAGGKGLRMGSALPKQFLPLAGRPVLMHTLERFARVVDEVILVLPEDHIIYWEGLCQEYDFTLPIRLALGGETRFHSVRSALRQLPKSGWVAVLHTAYLQPYQPTFTDDASVYEASGFGAPALVPGERTNIKITTPLDLSLAELLLTQA